MGRVYSAPICLRYYLTFIIVFKEYFFAIICLVINCIERLIVWVAEAQYNFHPRMLSFTILHFYYPHQLDATILKLFTEIGLKCERSRCRMGAFWYFLCLFFFRSTSVFIELGQHVARSVFQAPVELCSLFF